jgi:protoheme IX farnesyltransferase
MASAATATASDATAAAAAAARQPRVTGARALARDVKQLSKARLSLLVALTASTGYVLGDAVVVAGEPQQQQQEQGDGGSGATTTARDRTRTPRTRAEWWRGLAATTAGTWLAAAAANALNQLYEIRNDAAMGRTRLRPLPAGRLAPLHAALFALASGAAGVGLLWRESGGTAAGLGAANIALYAGVYTPLKQLTAANTWVGAVVGAIPPLMGWAAATRGASRRPPSEEEACGSDAFGAELRHPGAWLLALSLFSWQMPHFMALAWLCRDDYRAGGFRMLSTVGAGSGGGAHPLAAAARELAAGRRVAAVAVRHSLVLVPIGAAAAWLGLTEPGWHSAALAAEAGALGAAMAAASAAFWARPDAATARRAFRASLAYLPLLMLGMVVHRRQQPQGLEAPLAAAGMEAEGLAESAAAPLPPPPPGTWGEVRGRLAEAGWWWAAPGAPSPVLMSVRLRLRSPEERVAGVVLRPEEPKQQQQQQQQQEDEHEAASGGGGSAGALIAELRAALGLTHCPSRVYGEAVEGAEAQEEEEEEEEEEQGQDEAGAQQPEQEQQRARGRRRRR